jgi:hypothetical protein
MVYNIKMRNCGAITEVGFVSCPSAGSRSG